MEEVKDATSELKHLDADGGKLITASPLDYHIFRQEITSKYPAYTPAQPLIPLEPDNNSILPPLPNRPSRSNGANGILPPPMNVNSSGASILHQPVHIATPAPSPPPSPPVGGKAGKKQNYQTNQNFPFMYPPLDSTSNSAGGKGAAGLQEVLVGRRWQGSDIPKSILEAGDLFAKRMRMTRAMRQLWDEREKFLKFERGWDGEDDDIDELDLDTILSKKLSLHESPHIKPEVDYGPVLKIEVRLKEKLDLIEQFYVSWSQLARIRCSQLAARLNTPSPIAGHRVVEGSLSQCHISDHPACGTTSGARSWLQIRGQSSQWCAGSEQATRSSQYPPPEHY